MSDATSLKKAAEELCRRIADEVGHDSPAAPAKGVEQRQAGPNGSAFAGKPAEIRRRLFSEMAALRNSLEANQLEAGTSKLDDAAEAIKLLDDQRALLKLAKKVQTPAEKVSMYVRFVLTAVLAIWGAGCVLLLTPLRLIHPLCRSLGVPNGKLPMDILVEHWAKGVLAAAGVKVRIESSSNWVSQSDVVGIIVYNHASNLDPFIINATVLCGPKYIGKKVLFTIPVLGWLFILLGMVPINRGDREKAVNTMNEAVANIMKKWQRTVAISPEGTRTTDGHLRLPFKKGVFHLQEKTKVPLLPVAIRGTHELWPPGRIFTSPGEVVVNFLPAQYPVDGANSRDATRLALQRSYSEVAAKTPELGAGQLSMKQILACACRVSITLLSYWVITRQLPSLGAARWGTLFISLTIAVAFYVEKFL
jgi:1-acyl-sn-glycerol-3-phosphate acyltransferase